MLVLRKYSNIEPKRTPQCYDEHENFNIFYRLAGTFAGAFSYISEFHTLKRAGFATAMITVFMSGVFAYTSVIAILIIPMDWTLSILALELKPWRLFLICNSLFNLWNGIAFCCLPESPKFLLAMNRKHETLNVLSRIYAFNTGNSKKVSNLILELYLMFHSCSCLK